MVVSRLPFEPSHLISFDNVNLALALDEFDPGKHQPQPPGYPLFVTVARALRLLLGSAELTFQVLGLLASAISVGLLGLLGKEMFSPWVGRAAFLLFLVNPVLWFSGLASPLRSHLALVSVSTAYCCWQMWRGDARYLFPAAVALGLGGGFRPELVPLLFPLWLASAHKALHSARRLATAMLVLALAAGIWIAPLVISMGGPMETLRLLSGYVWDQTRPESLFLGAAPLAWSRMAGRMLVWNGLAGVAVLMALPFLRRHNRLSAAPGSLWLFLALWALPLLAFQLLVHVASPGHVLSTVPIFCLIAAAALAGTGKDHGQEPGIWSAAPRRESLLVAALLANILLFVAPFERPERPAAAAIGRLYYSLRDAALYARFETSAAMLGHLDTFTSESLLRLAELRAGTEVSLAIWNAAPMSWRQATYYAPDLPFVVLTDATAPGDTRVEAVLWRFNRPLKVSSDTPVRVPLPDSGSVIWLLNENSDFHRKLQHAILLHSAPPLFYSEVRELPASFQVDGFVFERTAHFPAPASAARTARKN